MLMCLFGDQNSSMPLKIFAGLEFVWVVARNVCPYLQYCKIYTVFCIYYIEYGLGLFFSVIRTQFPTLMTCSKSVKATVRINGC